MAFTIWQALALPLMAVLLTSTSAQSLSITPTNSSIDAEYSAGSHVRIGLGIWQNPTAEPVAALRVTALTYEAASNIPSRGLNGRTFVVNASNQLTTDSDDIALISCDSSTTNISPEDILSTTAERNVAAIVLYSTTARTCDGSGFGTYTNVYTTRSIEESEQLLMAVDVATAYASLIVRDTINGNGTSSGSASNNGSPLGPSPSTAVAMIILYSITGIITALFLCIIITGAVRAHRHPERYGPRNLIGRPRQTRARGLARAMLDSLPIVKVGDRTDQAAKPNEMELESGQHGPVEYVGGQTTGTVDTAATAATADSETTRNATNTPVAAAATTAKTAESGIAAAATESDSTKGEERPNQGCSICTEDFNVGEDQRVLPCDHRFHPDCIDPWLLNVSGTCPLCRIDLRPSDATDETTDSDGNSGLAPPLDGAEGSRAARVRRSIMLGILGSPRPERMSREERVAALRRYREGAAARSAEQEQGSATTAGQVEEESSRRRRYRDLFRIRTRRTGEPETAVHEEPAREAAAESSPSTAARTS